MCGKCNKEKPIQQFSGFSIVMCRECLEKEGQCVMCAKHNPEGTKLCSSCFNKAKGKCCHCGMSGRCFQEGLKLSVCWLCDVIGYENEKRTRGKGGKKEEKEEKEEEEEEEEDEEEDEDEDEEEEEDEDEEEDKEEEEDEDEDEEKRQELLQEKIWEGYKIIKGFKEIEVAHYTDYIAFLKGKEALLKPAHDIQNKFGF